jgi:hypothetical protein
MRLEGVAVDETVSTGGFKRQTFKCPICGDVEQRLAFGNAVGTSTADAIPLLATPGSSLAPPVHEAAAGPGFARRAFAKLAGICRAVERGLAHGGSRQPSVPDLAVPHAPAPWEKARNPIAPPASPGLAELEAVPAVSSDSGLRETDRDECENLLRRAIDLVRAPAGPSQGSPGAAQPDAGSIAVTAAIEPQGEPTVPRIAPKLVQGEAAARPGAASRDDPAAPASMAEPGPARPPQSASPVRAESPASRIVVQIEYDPVKAKFVARNSTTGLLILRHEDRALLQAMCERVGWQVAHGEATVKS